MQASSFILPQEQIVVEEVERYEVVNGGRLEHEPMGAFETVLTSWLC